eukprot:TRINITY_DN4830_c0_g1_i7.p1 TRINITY_DN4830_c0_g1~~TRINITY_DN4830_c0_g1_i7.p1  ORF type:complete len:118 (-),score=26.81 TRINITY_DN4830_c0_g1_i7:71-424(-)
MKTLGAILTGRWVMSPKWITESHKAGYFLPEGKYGRKASIQPYKGKKFFVTPLFVKEDKTKQKFGHIKTLVEDLGAALLVNTPEGADHVIGMSLEKSSFPQKTFFNLDNVTASKSRK